MPEPSIQTMLSIRHFDFHLQISLFATFPTLFPTVSFFMLF